MFYVIDKSKIYSYIVALSTVIILFVAAAKVNETVPTSENVFETSSNVIENSLVENNKLGNVNK